MLNSSKEREVKLPVQLKAETMLLNREQKVKLLVSLSRTEVEITRKTSRKTLLLRECFREEESFCFGLLLALFELFENLEVVNVKVNRWR